MIPLKDENPTSTTPFITVSLIVANILIFFYEVSLGPALKGLVYTYGAIPYELTHRVSIGEGTYVPPFLTVFSSMFLHGGFMHIAGNMLYLWIFGNNIEDSMGHIKFLIFYLLSGIVAAYTNAYIDRHSMVPMIGASGAISGVLGAYLLLFPYARVLTLVPLGFYFQIMRIPAVVVLGFWIVIQLFSGTLSLGIPQRGGVAWFAHIGGFVTGILLVGLFKKRGVRFGGGRRYY